MIEPVIYDPASDPKQFRSLAERLLEIDRIRLLFGCYMSSTRKAVLPVVEAIGACCFIRRSTRASNIRGTASIPARRRTRIRCNSQGPAFHLRQSLPAGGIELHLPL